MSLGLIHTCSPTRLKQMIWVPSFFFLVRPGLLHWHNQLLLEPVFISHSFLFYKTSNSVLLVEHCCHSDSLRGRARSHWMQLTSHDWANEPIWQWRLAMRFIIFSSRHFLGPEIAHQLGWRATFSPTEPHPLRWWHHRWALRARLFLLIYA